MTTATIRAKYSNGTLELLEKVNIPEGKEVAVRLGEPDIPTIDHETRNWLDANLSDLPPYEWEGKIPKGKPVRYDPKKGFVILDK